MKIRLAGTIFDECLALSEPHQIRASRMKQKKLESNLVPESVGLHATLLSSWVQVAYRTAIYMGLDADKIFDEAEIDLKLLQRPDSRIPSHKVKFVWDRSAQLSGCPAYGLKAAQVAYPGMYYSLSVTLSASSSIAELLNKLMRYRRIIDTIAINTLVETEEHLKFTWDPIVRYESQVGAEAWVACMLQICRWSAGTQLAPKLVTFAHPNNGDSDDYQHFFGGDVQFDMPGSAIYFLKSDAEKPLLTANAAIAAKNEQITAEYLSRVMRGDTINAVYSLLLSHMDRGTASVDFIASEMLMSSRSLQRKLNEAGTTYEHLLDDVRRELAVQYLNTQHISIQEIAHRLGFSNTSNFGRSFRRWTNKSPASYRNEKR
jgi:AraC-like DNA-binding protein